MRELIEVRKYSFTRLVRHRGTGGFSCLEQTAAYAQIRWIRIQEYPFLRGAYALGTPQEVKSKRLKG